MRTDFENIVITRGNRMETFRVENLPDIDQEQIKRGKCPWCLNYLIPGGLIAEDAGDSCPECGDEFVGKLTIED